MTEGKRPSLRQRETNVTKLVVQRLKKLGMTVGNERSGWISYQKRNAVLEFRVREKMKQGRVPLTESELRFRRLLNDPETDKFGLLPSGFLQIDISHPASVTETRKQPFEERIDYLVKRLVERLDATREKDIANQEQQQRWNEAMEKSRLSLKQSAEEERRRQAEEERWQRFVRISTEWQSMQAVQHFLDALVRRTDGLSADQVAWLKEQINTRDPLGQHRNLRHELA